MVYAIVWEEENAYWVTRVEDTDNYASDPADATLFAAKCYALALMRTLGLDDDHKVREINRKEN